MSIKLATAFLDRVQRSGLVSEDRLPQLRQELEDRGIDLANAGTIADALVDMGVLSRWQADKVLEGKHKGFFLGSYRLLRPLGRGGMGAVFLAEHEMMRRQCAIKVLPHSQIKEGSSVLKRFYVEAQAVAKLDHQNIVRAYDVNMEAKDGKEIHYLVMEYVEGRDIQTLVQEDGVLDYVTAAEYLRQTANGLAHAHGKGLIHRDIKPANLLVDKKGVVKVLDLGLARFFDDSGQASLTTAHNETVLGTADYLSPEQALNSHTVDHRTDIYSLGCTAYFMLAGHPPFPEGTVAQRLVAHQVKLPQPIKEKRRDIPSDLVTIVDKMMAKRPEDRFQSAEELSTVLARWLLEHGGDEWKRQHSEIAGDKALMSLLSSREPTRTIRSSMSETELELEMAPLDDDDHDDMAPSASRSGSNLNLAGSGIRKAAGESSASRRRAPIKSDSIDEMMPLTDDDEPVAAAPKSGASAAPASLPETLGNESTLPSLDDGLGAGIEPLPDLQQVDLASLDTSDLLGGLDQHDMATVAPGDDPLGAMDSDLRQVTLASGGGSSSRSHRRIVPVAEKTFEAPTSVVGLPIMIGGAAGLVLVLIILALVNMSTKPETAKFDPGQVRPPDSALATPDGTRDQDAQPSDPARIPDEDRTPSPLRKDPVKEPAVEVAVAPPEPKPPDREPTQDTVPAVEPKPEPAKPVDEPRPQPEPKPDPPSADTLKPETKKSVEEPAPKPEPPVRTLTPQQRLAAIEGFRAEVKGPGDGRKPPAKLPPQLGQLLNSITLAVGREVEDTAKRYKLKFDADQKPLLILQPNMQAVAPNIVLTLRAELTVEDESGQTVSLWENEAELASFLPSANPTIVLGNARSTIVKFFRDFREKYDAAVASHPAP
jgi:serine/threonine protein kinase